MQSHCGTKFSSSKAKLIVLGSYSSGKSSFIIRSVNEYFPTIFKSTIVESCVSKTYKVGDKIVSFEIWVSNTASFCCFGRNKNFQLFEGHCRAGAL